MLKQYQDSCDSLGATANSAVLAQLEEDERSFSADRISLSVNYLGDRGLRAFLPVVSRNGHLKYLNLSRQGMHNAAAVALCEAFIYHPSLANIDVSRNRIGEKGGLALLQLAEYNEALLTLTVEGNDFRFKIRSEIEKAMESKQRAPSRLMSLRTGPQVTEAPLETDIDDTESIAPPAFTPVDSYYSLPESRRVSQSAEVQLVGNQMRYGRNP